MRTFHKHKYAATTLHNQKVSLWVIFDSIGQISVFVKYHSCSLVTVKKKIKNWITLHKKEIMIYCFKVVLILLLKNVLSESHKSLSYFQRLAISNAKIATGIPVTRYNRNLKGFERGKAEHIYMFQTKHIHVFKNLHPFLFIGQMW